MASWTTCVVRTHTRLTGCALRVANLRHAIGAFLSVLATALDFAIRAASVGITSVGSAWVGVIAVGVVRAGEDTDTEAKSIDVLTFLALRAIGGFLVANLPTGYLQSIAVTTDALIMRIRGGTSREAPAIRTHVTNLEDHIVHRHTRIPERAKRAFRTAWALCFIVTHRHAMWFREPIFLQANPAYFTTRTHVRHGARLPDLAVTRIHASALFEEGVRNTGSPRSALGVCQRRTRIPTKTDAIEFI